MPKISKPNLYANFTPNLLYWHQNENRRQLPWVNEKDPYKIWLREIILQQTRVNQGLGYYQKFIDQFPTIFALASAEDDFIFKCWEGLGYYKRCQNLIYTARYLVQEKKGKFPVNYQDLLQLKGVGSYTAAAICSFAFQLPFPVIDGNVIRVVSRYFLIKTPSTQNQTRRQISSILKEIFPAHSSSTFNQAIIDLGATVCLPKTPYCPKCPLAINCLAYRQKLTHIIPNRKTKPPLKKRYFIYFILHYKNQIALHKRTNKDIWQNLYDFFLIESACLPPTSKRKALELLKLHFTKIKIKTIEFIGNQKQSLSHQKIISTFFKIQVHLKPRLKENYFWIDESQIGNFAFPKSLQFIKKNI